VSVCSESILYIGLIENLADQENKDDPRFGNLVGNSFIPHYLRSFDPLKPRMTTPEVTRCPDGHFRRVIYGLGPYIADYPEASSACIALCKMVPMVHSDTYLSFIVTLFYNSEQVYSEARRPRWRRRAPLHEHTNALLDLLDLKTLWDDYGIVGDIIVSRIVDLETHMLTRTGSHSPLWPTLPCADIHETSIPGSPSSDHKGTFKDHLVTWVGAYLRHEHGPAHAAKIMADIDRRQVLIILFHWTLI